MTSLVPEWIEVDESRYDKEVEQKKPRGIVVSLSVSPHEVPQLVRGQYDSERKRFIIEFRYLDDESTHSVRIDEHTHAHVGKRSNRIYSIEIDVESLNVGAVAWRVEVDKAIRDLAAPYRTRHAKPSHYEMAKKVVSDYWGRLSSLTDNVGAQLAAPR
ncbi:hypothetical protein [Lysobacter sp. CFH 32150]|uniref:hypothetical protein n=1 Tax=Lysobacter sp. CFH 32150 TaxID=2927128 RepID=UPI001FA7C07E|nr:hypothetical protein [Lysobacter sp. CFH 32150]MCI4567570.1 hypothetical protein [Lysobacter sp. CFH 32150]